MNIRPFALERYFARYEFETPYLLCCSDCESFSIREILDMEPESADKFQNLWLGYTESSGNPMLKEEISKLYTTVSADDILVHAGAEEAIFNFIHAFLTPSDHIIVHYPCYQSLFEVAKAVGCEVTLWHADKNRNWESDTDFVEAHLKSNTKAVILNCPHNPTGYLMSQDQFRALTDLSRKHGFLIFSDEVYRFLEYDEQDRLPALCDLDDRGISLGVMSKSFGLAGLRIGWIATHNKALYRKMAAFKDYITICSSAPSEFLATVALQHKDRLIHRNLKIIRHNLSVLDAFFKQHQNYFGWQKPKAGPIAFPYLKHNGDANRFCEQARKSGVLLLPGTLYDNAYRSHFRIGFGRANMPECLDRLHNIPKESVL